MQHLSRIAESELKLDADNVHVPTLHQALYAYLDRQLTANHVYEEIVSRCAYVPTLSEIIHNYAIYQNKHGNPEHRDVFMQVSQNADLVAEELAQNMGLVHKNGLTLDVEKLNNEIRHQPVFVLIEDRSRGLNLTEITYGLSLKSILEPIDTDKLNQVQYGQELHERVDLCHTFLQNILDKESTPNNRVAENPVFRFLHSCGVSATDLIDIEALSKLNENQNVDVDGFTQLHKALVDGYRMNEEDDYHFVEERTQMAYPVNMSISDCLRMRVMSYLEQARVYPSISELSSITLHKVAVLDAKESRENHSNKWECLDHLGVTLSDVQMYVYSQDSKTVITDAVALPKPLCIPLSDVNIAGANHLQNDIAFTPISLDNVLVQDSNINQIMVNEFFHDFKEKAPAIVQNNQMFLQQHKTKLTVG